MKYFRIKEIPSKKKKIRKANLRLKQKKGPISLFIKLSSNHEIKNFVQFLVFNFF